MLKATITRDCTSGSINIHVYPANLEPQGDALRPTTPTMLKGEIKTPRAFLEILSSEFRLRGNPKRLNILNYDPQCPITTVLANQLFASAEAFLRGKDLFLDTSVFLMVPDKSKKPEKSRKQ